MTVGAMCASLATTASLLTIYSGPRDAFNRAAMIVIRVFDLCAFLFISFLLFARISSAVVINHTTQHSLRAASRISSNIVNDLANTLSCTVEPRDELPICSRQIIDSIFPVKLIEYLIILCLLTGAYIGLGKSRLQFNLVLISFHFQPTWSSGASVTSSHQPTRNSLQSVQSLVIWLLLLVAHQIILFWSLPNHLFFPHILYFFSFSSIFSSFFPLLPRNQSFS